VPPTVSPPLPRTSIEISSQILEKIANYIEKYLDEALSSDLELVGGDDERDDPFCDVVEAVNEQSHIRCLLWLLRP